MKVLIADDDNSVRHSLGKVLKEVGYDVVLAKDGHEAVKLFDAHQIGFLLLDLGLPTRDGWDTFERITSETPELPVIIITGKTDQRNTALAAGVGALMEKPLDVAELLQMMRVLLAEPKEDRLRHLCGYSQDFHCIPPADKSSLRRLRTHYPNPFRQWASTFGGREV